MTTTPTEQAPDLLTVAEAAAILRCNPETVRRAIRRGDLPATRPTGKLIRIDRADLKAGAR